MADSNTNITPLSEKESATEENTWKFSQGEKLISELTKKEVLITALHCLKRMRYYGDQVEFFIYKVKTTRNEKKADNYRYQQTRANNLILFFSQKLDKISERALDHSIVLPDTFDEIKDLLSQHRKEEEALKKAEEKNSEDMKNEQSL